MTLELEAVHSEIMVCTKCELHKSRTKAVPGEGPRDAKVFFVGEGPGQNEDEQGRPFVGAAGKFLTELLESIGLKRSEVFITNIVKCRPPGNRAPRKEEIEACKWYLEAQISLIKPRIICPLGTPAITSIMGDDYSATKVHGKPSKRGEITILPLYHPAAALYDNKLRDVLFEDFKVLKQLLLSNSTSNNHASTGEKPDEARQPLEKWM